MTTPHSPTNTTSAPLASPCTLHTTAHPPLQLPFRSVLYSSRSCLQMAHSTSNTHTLSANTTLPSMYSSQLPCNPPHQFTPSPLPAPHASTPQRPSPITFHACLASTHFTMWNHSNSSSPLPRILAHHHHFRGHHVTAFPRPIHLQTTNMPISRTVLMPTLQCHSLPARHCHSHKPGSPL